jgi:uncharacterized HhH-GPD family protein
MLARMPKIQIAQDPAADRLLSEDPFALVIGMLLDQQFPMERAFAGPAVLAERFGQLDPAAVAAADPEDFAALCARTPAVHRYPGSMASRMQALAAYVLAEYGGDTGAIWRDVPSGQELLARVRALPGFGGQKAAIFVALLGKQLGVRPDGWREAAGAYGDEGSYRSVADVVDPDSLAKVRAFKQEQKTANRAGDEPRQIGRPNARRM